MIGQVASKGSSALMLAAQASSKEKPPAKVSPAPKQPSASSNPIFGVGSPPKPGHAGGTGTQGPAPGIQSPAKVEVGAKEGSRNLSAKIDGSIQYATAARIDSKLVTTQKTAEPRPPLKTRAEAMRGQHVDVRG